MLKIRWRILGTPGTKQCMEIMVQNHMSTVTGASQEVLDFLHGFLVIERRKFTRDKFTGRFQFDGVDLERLFDPYAGTFMTGFLPRVRGALKKRGVEFSVRDERSRPAGRDEGADLAWLRSYQLESIDVGIARKRGILQLSTGAGKTEIVAGLTRALPIKWLFLVHKKTLMRDAAARIRLRAEQHGLEPPDIGMFGDGEKELHHRLTLATFQTISQNVRQPAVKKMLSTTQGLLVDECHTLAAQSFSRVVAQCKNAYYRFGLSGTPLARGDQRSTYAVGLLGPVIHKVGAQELIAHGVLSTPIIRFIRYKAADVSGGVWAMVKLAGIVNNHERNRAILWAVQRADRPCVLFVDSIDHGRYLHHEIEARGINAEFVWGKSSTAQRQAYATRLERGEVDVVVASTVWSEGVDIPCLAAVIMGAGGKSNIQALQRLGRGMRRSEGKSTFEVWDFDDRHHRILENHAVERRRAYQREGHEVQFVDAGFTAGTAKPASKAPEVLEDVW